MFAVCLLLTCSGTTISATVDEVELEDGTKTQPITIMFPDGNEIHIEDRNQVKINKPN